MILSAIAVVVGGLVAAPAAHTGGPSAFSAGFYCGPPLEQSTPERFVQALDAGFTFSMPPCGDDTGYTVAQNVQILDAAQAAGMPVMVMDNRMQEALDNPIARPQLLDAIVNSYSSHPALWGYFVYDEVPPELIGAVAAVVAGLRARDPRHPAYVSLFPDYYPAIPDYDQYVRNYVRQIHPAAIIYDYYPFLADGSDRTGFFANLNSVRRVALESSTPFWFFAQLTELPGLRRASESEKRWQALQVLAYGARGLMFFTYWSNVTAGFPEPGVIDPRTGLPTGHYPEVQRVNSQVRAFAQALGSARSQSVFHNGPLAPSTVTRVPRASVYVRGSAPITAGLFDSADYTYAMLANRDYHTTVSTAAVLSFGASRPQRLDLSSGRWVTVRAIRKQAHSLTVSLTLPPAAGALFRTRKPVPLGPPGAEAVFGRVRSNAGHWHLVDSHGKTYELRGATWNECPSGFTLVGAKFQPHGFWLCVRRDLAANRFYVGNVVGDLGNRDPHHRHQYFRVRGRAVKMIRSEPWSRCRGASRLLGRFDDPNGFWVCMEGRLTRDAAFGRVRSNTGDLHVAGPRRRMTSVGREAWGYCPLGSALVGQLRRANGFWLCARSDLARRAFYVGNVVNGSARYYRVHSGRVRRLPSAPWLYCRGRSRLIGRFANPDGFWLCVRRAE
jgi:hypothetical protein